MRAIERLKEIRFFFVGYDNGYQFWLNCSRPDFQDGLYMCLCWPKGAT